jgi:hypothetical protein
MNKLLTIIYEELGLLMLILSVTLMPATMLMGIFTIAYMVLNW